MKNVTVSMPEDLARWARIWAAEQEVSVSALLAGLLQAKRDEQFRYEASYQEVLAERPVNVSGGTDYPSRNSLYDR